MAKLTPEKLTAFCAALSETCQVGRACKAVGISRQTAYQWREQIPEFAEAWEKALRIGTSALEDEAIRRGHDGWEEPVFHQGEEVSSVRKYSDTLLIFTLKAHAPEKYRESSKLELSGHLNISKLSDDEIRQELAALAAAGLVPVDANSDDLV